MSDLSRRSFLTSVAALCAASPALGSAAPDSSLRPFLRGAEHFKRAIPAVDEIIATHGLSGQVAFALAEAETGEWLECRNEHLGTPPASVTKAVTALYALETLGAGHRFATRLIATGPIVEGQIEGDLVLAGGCDPTLDTNGLAQMAADLKTAGIFGVKGDFKVSLGGIETQRVIDPGQPDQVGYNPAVSGIALNFNRVHFEWKRQGADYTVAMDARSDRYRPEVRVARMAVAERSTPIYTYADQGSFDQWSVARGALGKGGSRWLPVRKPALYAGEVFATLARAHGIVLGRAEVLLEAPEGQVLVTRESAPLRAVLQGMLKYSTNITAEMVGLAASRARGVSVPGLRASAEQMNRWAGESLGMSSAALVDHSGLGDASRLTALDMARALYQVRERGLRPILKPFLMRDSDGKPNKESPIAVDAKTGTLNFVSTLAGYITSREGEEMVFAIFTADTDKRAGIARADRERPAGARTWNRRSKRVQQGLIERWDLLYGT